MLGRTDWGKRMAKKMATANQEWRKGMVMGIRLVIGAEAADLRVDFQAEAEVLVVGGAVVLGRLIIRFMHIFYRCIFIVLMFAACTQEKKKRLLK